MTEIPQLSFPLRVVGDTFATVEQGSVADVRSQIHLLVRTPPGWFGHGPDDPLTDMGLGDQAHRKGGADAREIERQILAHVPNAEAVVAEDASALNDGLSVIGVRVGSRGEGR
jgi:hypothetical protein